MKVVRAALQGSTGDLSACRSRPRAQSAVHPSDAATRESNPYWRAHPIRADRLARALAAKTRAPVGWTWRISHNRKTGLAATFRAPPAPYRERVYNLGPGFCCVCGQPVYRLGWHTDPWGTGLNKKAVWHCACVIAWQFWNAPNSEAALLRRLQGRRCFQTGGRLWRDAEVDHRVPLFRVWKDTGTSNGRSCSPTGACQTSR